MEKQKTSAVVFVGYKTELDSKYLNLRPDFQAPKNVVKEETKQKKIAEKEVEYAEGAHNYVHAGRITEIVTLEPGQGERVFTGTEDFIGAFNGEHGSRFDGEGYPIDGAVRFVGANIRTFVKMLWAQQADQSHEQLPPGVLHATHVDVHDILVPSGFKTSLSVDKILQECYLAPPSGTELVRDVRVAGLVTLAYNLFPHLKFEIAELFPESEEAMC